MKIVCLLFTCRKLTKQLMHVHKHIKKVCIHKTHKSVTGKFTERLMGWADQKRNE